MNHQIAVAWYPEHNDRARWDRDLTLMREHGVDAVRVLEFAWSRLEPEPGRRIPDEPGQLPQWIPANGAARVRCGAEDQRSECRLPFGIG